MTNLLQPRCHSFRFLRRTGPSDTRPKPCCLGWSPE